MKIQQKQKTKKQKRMNLSFGVIAKVAQALKCSHQAASYKLKSLNPEAINLAAKIEYELKIEKQKALRKMNKSIAMKIEPCNN